MNELLGFAVLTSPLWLVLILAAIAVLAAMLLAKRVKRRGVGAVLGFSVFAVLLVLPFADTIFGKILLSHLCAKEAGVKVYRTVELPAEFWDEQGRPRYFAPSGFADMKLLSNRFEWHDTRARRIDFVVKIDSWRWQLRDKATKETLGEKLTYLRYLGWAERLSPAPTVGESCRDLGGEFARGETSRRELEQEQLLFRGVFRPATASRQGG